MEYFDFIKPGELYNLPEDPQLAFARIVEIAQPRLAAQLIEIGHRDEQDYESRRDAQYGFQSVVMGAARKFGIEPFAGAELPLIVNYSTDDYRQFRHDLSSYITQIMLTAADADRSNSVPLLDKTRQSIETYIFHLRTAIDATDLPDTKKTAMHSKLDALEAEIGRKRVRLVIVTAILMHILSAPGELTTSYDAVSRITTNIMRELGQAKAADDEQRRISIELPVALLPLRPQVKPARKMEPDPIAFQRDELDDEIPF